MSTHIHKLPADNWPFADPENGAAIACRHVLEGHPVLRVTHDDDDGSWQMLCGESHEAEDAKVVCLGCMVGRDPGLASLADLPLGWCADRQDSNSPWRRVPND